MCLQIRPAIGVSCKFFQQQGLLAALANSSGWDMVVIVLWSDSGTSMRRGREMIGKKVAEEFLGLLLHR
jgi:hypothetical protein